MSNFRGSYQFTNDIIVRAGTFKIPSGKTLQMRDGYRIYVLEGGTLEVDGGTIQNADVLVKSGGTLNIKNNALRGVESVLAPPDSKVSVFAITTEDELILTKDTIALV